MKDEKDPTTSQLRKDLRPAATPLGTDDEAAGTTPSRERVEMAQKAEQKIEEAHKKRGASTPYGKEEHMNEELAKRKESEAEGDPSEQPS